MRRPARSQMAHEGTAEGRPPMVSVIISSESNDDLIDFLRALLKDKSAEDVASALRRDREKFADMLEEIISSRCDEDYS